MPTFTITPLNRQDRLRQVDAGQVAVWLEARGVVVDDVTMVSGDDGLISIVIESDQDPTTQLDQFEVEPTAQQTARQFLRDVLPALTDGTATTAQMRNALRALIILQGD